MTTAEAPEVVAEESPVAVFKKYDQQIALFKEQCADITFDTKEGYEKGRITIGKIVALRSGVETVRTELKAPVLKMGRLIDDEAKRIEKALLEIESPLKAKRKLIDDAAEVERVHKATEAREKIEAEARANLAAEQAIKDAEDKKAREEQEARDAERRAAEAKLAEDNRIERERLAEIERKQAEAQKKIDDERAALEAAKAKQEQAERERLIKLQAEKDTADRIERERLAAEGRKAEQERLRVAEETRIAAARPDVEKIRMLSDAITALALMLPEVTSDKASKFVKTLRTDLTEMAEDCATFEV